MLLYEFSIVYLRFFLFGYLVYFLIFSGMNIIGEKMDSLKKGIIKYMKKCKSGLNALL